MTAVASIPASAGASQVKAGNLPSAPTALEGLAAVLVEGGEGAAAGFPALLDSLIQQEPATLTPADRNSEGKKPEGKKEDRKESALLCVPVAVPELAVPVPPASAPPAGLPQSAIGGDLQIVPPPDAPRSAPPELEPNEALTALPEGKANEAPTGNEPEAGAIAAPDVNPIPSTLPPLPAVSSPISPPASIEPSVSSGARNVERMVEISPEIGATAPEPVAPAGPIARSRISEPARPLVEAPRSVAVEPSGTPWLGTPVLAFTARLTRLDAAEKDTAVASQPAPVPPVEPVAPVAGAADGGAASPELPRAPATSPVAAVRISPVASRETKPAEPSLQDAGSSDTVISTAPQTAETPAARRQPAIPAAEPQRSQAPAPEPAPPVSPARDIRLQVANGDRRVDVRLTERGGQVEVSVRTPDPQLAGALRDDLTALSARLEQSGFRAEMWHPAGTRTEHLSPGNESSAAGSSWQQQPSGGQGRQQQHEPPPRRGPQPDINAGGDSAGEEFLRLFSSLP